MSPVNDMDLDYIVRLFHVDELSFSRKVFVRRRLTNHPHDRAGHILSRESFDSLIDVSVQPFPAPVSSKMEDVFSIGDSAILILVGD
jgi:phage head maturation protease